MRPLAGQSREPLARARNAQRGDGEVGRANQQFYRAPSVRRAPPGAVGYELLKRVAEREGDGETVDLAGRIGRQERAAARTVAEGFDLAVDASLSDLDVALAR